MYSCTQAIYSVTCFLSDTPHLFRPLRLFVTIGKADCFCEPEFRAEFRCIGNSVASDTAHWQELRNKYIRIKNNDINLVYFKLLIFLISLSLGRKKVAILNLLKTSKEKSLTVIGLKQKNVLHIFIPYVAGLYVPCCE